MSEEVEYSIENFIQELDSALSKLKKHNWKLYPFIGSCKDIKDLSAMGVPINVDDCIYLSNGQMLSIKDMESFINIKAFEDKETPYRGRVS